MTADPPDVEGLAQIKMSLHEKLTVLKGLDTEILELVESEDAVTEEIEQADVFKQDMYAVLVRIERLQPEVLPICPLTLRARRPELTLPVAPPARSSCRN